MRLMVFFSIMQLLFNVTAEAAEVTLNCKASNSSNVVPLTLALDGERRYALYGPLSGYRMRLTVVKADDSYVTLLNVDGAAAHGSRAFVIDRSTLRYVQGWVGLSCVNGSCDQLDTYTEQGQCFRKQF
jgi:hypothetical protein